MDSSDMEHRDRIDDLLKEESPVNEYAQRRVHDAWEWMLKDRRGRVVLRDLLQITNFGVSAFGGNGEITLVNSGKQICGEHVMNMVNANCPKSYFLMIQESKEDEEYDRSEHAKRTSSGDTSGGHASTSE